METPLIYTTKGNVPCAELRLNPVWEFGEGYTKLNVEHYLGDEMVRNDVYVYDRIGLNASGVAAELG